jgi:hypothetical protein
MVPEVGIAPTSPPLQGGANLPQLLGVKMVVPAGNAPASSGYRPGALLLSYRTMAEGVGSAPTSAMPDPVFETGAASLYLPAFHKMAARVGLAPTPCGLTGRRATLTPPGNGAAGRTCTCIVPFRRRMPDLFRPRQHSENGQRGRICTCDPPGPKPGALTELRSRENGGSEGVRTLSLPADNGLLR